jgi:predicted phosphodiesterase
MALYGLLGDIHGNREALEASLWSLCARGVEQMLCVGDLVGYNADPDECVSILRAHGAISIAGNHDLIGAGQLGFDRCSNKAMHSLKRTRRYIRRRTLDYLLALPSHHVVEDSFLLTHGGVRDVQQYMTQPKHILENVAYLRHDFPGVKIAFFGHTHEQKVFEVHRQSVREIPADGLVVLREDREYFINPGSVDASRKRSHKFAEFAVFDSDILTVEFFRTAYDDMSTEMKAAAEGFRIDRWRDRLYDVQRRLIGPRHKEQSA